MNKLRIVQETPRELLSYACDIGKGAIKGFIRYVNEVPECTPGAAVEQPLDTADWPIVHYSDKDIKGLTTHFHEIEVRKTLADAA